MTTKQGDKKLLIGPRIWRANRLKYPGWIIAPKTVRKRIWLATENWINPISDRSSSYSTYERLFMFRELNWRLELTLMPLFSNFAEAVNELLNGIKTQDLSSETLNFSAAIPQPSSSLPEERLLYAELDSLEFEFSEAEVKRSWAELNLGYLRFLREERRPKEFVQLADSILTVPFLQPDDITFVRYEQALFGLSNFKPENARDALANWPETSSLIWQSRKASIHLQLGQIEMGHSIAQNCYERIQKTLRNHLTNLSLLSCEAWLVMMLQAIQNHFEFSNKKAFNRVSLNNFERRIGQLARMKYDPWQYIGEFRDFVEQSPPTYKIESTSAGFHPHQFSTTHHMGANNFRKEMPAYEAMRFSEIAPLPHGFGNINLFNESLRKAAEWMIPRDSIRADSVMLLLKDMKLIKSYLSRHRVAAMDLDRVKSLFEIVKDGVTKAISPSEKNDPMSNEPEAVCVQFQVSTGIEIMARLCVRLSTSEQLELLDFAFSLFRSEAVARNRHTSDPITTLLHSLILSIPTDSLRSKFRDFVSLPIPNADGYLVGNSHSWPYPVYMFAQNVSDIGEVKTQDWNDCVDRLLELAVNGHPVARKRAVVQIDVLCNFGCLGKKRLRKFADVYWAKVEISGLPKSDVFHEAHCLALPAPKGVDVQGKFRAHALATAPDSSGTDINKLVKNWLDSERVFRDESNPNRKVVEWSETDLKRMIELANQQWEKLKKELEKQVSQAQQFASAFGEESIEKKIQNLLYALRDVVFPRASKAMKQSLKVLIDDISANSMSIQMLLPIMPLIGSDLDIEAKMRLGLASHDRHVYVTTLQGLLFWVRSESQSKQSNDHSPLPELPINLIRELGVIVANRRQPHLDQAMAAVEVYLHSSGDTLDAQFLNSLNHGLHYLQTELDYRFWDDGSSHFGYDQIPNLRLETVQIALCMKNIRGVDSDAVIGWIETAKVDALPEIRRVVADTTS